MACVYSVVVYGPDAAALASAAEQAFDEVDRIDRLMSHYRPESPLSRLNREAASGPVAVEPELLAFLAECLRYSRESGGAFDITVGPLMKAWGFFGGEGRLPEDAEVAAAGAKVGYRHVVLDRDRATVAFDQPGVELDLGGIAKGYAVDRAAKRARERGRDRRADQRRRQHALRDGRAARAQRVGDRHRGPASAREDRAQGSCSATVRCPWRAVAASSSRRVASRTRTSWTPAPGDRCGRCWASAVITESGTEGDALDDAFFVLGPTGTREYLSAASPTEAFMFLPEGRGSRLVHLVN